MLFDPDFDFDGDGGNRQLVIPFRSREVKSSIPFVRLASVCFAPSGLRTLAQVSLFRPERPGHTSPGQRPGNEGIPYSSRALKGRNTKIGIESINHVFQQNTAVDFPTETSFLTKAVPRYRTPKIAARSAADAKIAFGRWDAPISISISIPISIDP
jgi:hypothetical protein